MRKTLVLGIALMALGMIGCVHKGSAATTAPTAVQASPVIAKIVIDFPGASPETIDAAVFPHFRSNVSIIPHVRTFTCISRHGVFEGYVVADPNTDIIELQDRLYSAVPVRYLPSDARKPIVRFIRDGAPKVTPKAVPNLVVKLDGEELTALGLRTSDVEAVLPKEPPDLSNDSKAVESVAMLIIAYRNGRPVYMRDIATLKIEQKPDCIVHTYPTKE